MATKRTKSINDIVRQRTRIQELANELQARNGGEYNARFNQIKRRNNRAQTKARDYINNIRSTNTFNNDGGNNTMSTSMKPYSRKYKNYAVDGKASAAG